MLKFETSDGRFALLVPGTIRGFLPGPEKGTTVLMLPGDAFLTVVGDVSDVAQYAGANVVTPSES